jgi:integrase
MFNLAIKWDFAEINPVKKVSFFKERSGRLRYLTSEEIERLLSVCPAHLRNIVELAIHTGLRRGELFSLKWRDIDFENRMLTIQDTKNHEDRVIPLNDNAMIVVQPIPRQLRSDYVFTTAATKR